MIYFRCNWAIKLLLLCLLVSPGAFIANPPSNVSAHRGPSLVTSDKFRPVQSASVESSSDDGVWQMEPTARGTLFSDLTHALPSAFCSFTLNQERFRQILNQDSSGRKNGAQELPLNLTFPFPDGTFSKFELYESSVMDPVLAAKFPNIRTYTGKSLDRSAVNLRLTQTPGGVFATMLSGQEMILVEPRQISGETIYISYFLQFAPDRFDEFECFVTPEMEQLAQPEAVGGFGVEKAVLATTIPHRTFRLAVATTAEYSQSIWGRPKGPIEDVLAEIVRLVSSVNLVYAQELAIEFVLVDRIELLVFGNTQTDPFSGSLAQKAEQNQRTIDRTIGAQNYDIGHLLDASTGGIGYIGGVCTTENKAKGVTATNAVFTMVHELGHQFGALHTFNSTAAECSGNRTPSAAYEIGSGTTIMSYGGKCKPEAVQYKPDLYFHTDSLERILNRLENTSGQFGPDCSVQTETGHLRPAIEAGQNYIIPFNTPFTLVATELSPGSPLYYCWEEFDLGNASPPQTGVGSQPIFRSYPPVLSRARTFPRLENVLSNTTQYGEALPQTARTLNFRCTVRDQAGGINFDSMTVSVLRTGVGFAVTKPNTAVTFKSGTPQTITWSTARTNVSPINCTQVKILLSVDGGYTYTSLMTSTPNDGSEVVTLPSGINTTKARIKIEAVGNIFFDVSNVNFTITP